MTLKVTDWEKLLIALVITTISNKQNHTEPQNYTNMTEQDHKP